MSASAEVVSQFLDSIYEAAACPDRWPHFLEKLRTVTGANKAFFVLGSRGECDLSLQTGFENQAVRAYESYYSQLDPILHGFLEQMEKYGSWIEKGESVISKRELRRTEIFNDFMRPNGDAYQCGAALTGMGGGLFAGISILRSEAQGDFDQETIGLLATLAPHLKRSLGLHRMLTRLRVENEDMRSSIESFGLALVSLDGDGRVIGLTEPARKLLNVRDGLELVDNKLLASVAKENARLRELIMGAAATGSGRGVYQTVSIGGGIWPQASAKLWSAPSGGAMLISRQPPKRPLQIVVSPFRSTEILLEERPALIIFLNDPDAQPVSRAAVLRSLYLLSPMEGRVVDLLVNGLDVAQIAEQLLISQQTVRFYLKAVFKKTRTKRQSELLRIVMALPGSSQE